MLRETKLGGSLPVDPSSADAGDICGRVVSVMRALHPDRQFHLEAIGDLRGKWDAARIEQLLSKSREQRRSTWRSNDVNHDTGAR